MKKKQRKPRDWDGLEKRRREAMRLYKKGFRQVEVARACGVSRCSALRWERQFKKGGPTAWKRRPTGRPPKLTEQQWERLKLSMRQGALKHGFPSDLWTLRRIAKLIHRQNRVHMSLSQLWRIYGKMGWRKGKAARKAKK